MSWGSVELESEVRDWYLALDEAADRARRALQTCIADDRTLDED